jgi:protein-S-isoprenylcysteine O-methyltransferase Ste14
MQWEALCRNADRLLFRQLMQRRLEQGEHSMSQPIHGEPFPVEAGEPPVLSGKDHAQNPGEYPPFHFRFQWRSPSRGHQPFTVTSADKPLEKGGAMKRMTAFCYGTLCYLLFLATFLYAIAFLGNFGLTRTIDGDGTMPFGQALLINTLLLGLFAVQHSVMARPAFKRWWTTFVPKPVERSTYVLFSSAALLLLFYAWQPMGGVIWDVQDQLLRGVLYALFAGGLLLVLIATFLINHFDLFGMRQVWLYLQGRPYVPLTFSTPGLYRFVRHPLYVGWLVTFWAAPTMTAAHLVFALATTIYILLAIRWEERDLTQVHGEAYEAYRERVPMLIPAVRASATAGHPAPVETA